MRVGKSSWYLSLSFSKNFSLTRNSDTISNNHVINNEFNNEKISSKISDFSSATGQDTNVAKIDSFGGKTGDVKSDKL